MSFFSFECQMMSTQAIVQTHMAVIPVFLSRMYEQQILLNP